MVSEENDVCHFGSSGKTDWRRVSGGREMHSGLFQLSERYGSRVIWFGSSGIREEWKDLESRAGRIGQWVGCCWLRRKQSRVAARFLSGAPGKRNMAFTKMGSMKE